MFFNKNPLPEGFEYLGQHFVAYGSGLQEHFVFKDSNSNRAFLIIQLKDGWINSQKIDIADIKTKEQAIEEFVNNCKKQIAEYQSYIDFYKSL